MLFSITIYHRPFKSVGLFIAMLGYVVNETLVFASICFEIIIPYMVGFWILFGGSTHGQTMKDSDEDHSDWQEMNNMMFTVWQITMVADFNITAILAVDKVVALVSVLSSLFYTVLCVSNFCVLRY